MPTLRDIVTKGLSHLPENGRRTLAVDAEARQILRSWMQGRKTTPRQEAAQPAPESVEDKLAYLRERAEHWAPARRLGSLRDTMVFAVGNPHARLMLVGEAPGYDEELRREPFVGKAGQKLNDILRAMGLARAEIYISNICKFRPSMGANQGTANRPPTPEEISACLPLIQAEIRAIAPECIVCLGATAAKGLLGSEGSVGSLRGAWWETQGVPVRVTYHPSYLLRNEALSARRAVWEDMLAVMERLSLPISPKQRAFFLPKN
ncbi:MAG: uracil-DNA glycosylase [Akkermansiaceae bacterium]|nr:uracil-DNA glycosylase [Akkermansiaceae bacterium]